ncbi:hypothetical protein [Gordonia sp. 'Campus']|uniref:Rv1733c family protein n=1 Tax=Gordonia sp. 'Campus' TaxID=2915824 RepID=UPI001EE4680E|nr:hypothetical protein [Gordonia sp. 'Campus']
MLRFLARELHSWRFMHASSNGLVRAGDRLETTVLSALSLAALAGLMVALTVGGDTYAAHRAAAAEQSPRHSVSTTVVRAPEREGDDTTVAWKGPDGRRLTATVPADRLDSPGRVRIVWIDDAGAVVPPPLTNADAVVEGIVAGAAVAMLVALGWWGASALVRAAADRHRSRRWDAAWRDLDVGSHH